MDYNKALATTQASYSNKTPDGLKKNKELSDRTSKVYEDDKNVYIAYRGTDPRNKADLFADAFILRGLGDYSPRYRTAREKLTKTKNYYHESNKNIVISGHSLGGNIVKNLAKHEEGISSAYAFNAGTNPYYMGDSLRDKLFTKEDKKKTHTYEYSTGSDPISLGIHVPEKNTTKTIVGRKSGSDPHTLSNFEFR